MGSEQNYFLPKSMTPASPLDRLAAQLIDVILLIITSFAIAMYAGTHGLVISIGLFVVYFLICHYLWGQTLGKKMIGIRLISIRAQSLTFWRLILRETLGRIFCLGSLFLGYMRIIVFKDRRGLHDFFSGSAVVSDEKFRTSFAHFLAIVFTVALTFSFSTYYLLFKTTFIAKVGLHVLQSQGLKVSSLTGNMADGWSVDSFAGGNSFMSYSAKGIHFAHSPSGFYSRGTWHVQQLSIKELDVKISPQLLNFSYFQRKPASAVFNAPMAKDLQFAFFNIKGLVDLFKVESLKISDGEKFNMQLSDLSVSGLNYANGTMTVSGFKTSEKSESKVDVSHFVYKPIEKILQLRMKMSAPKKVYSLLKKDLQMTLSWQGSLVQPERFKLMTFDNRLNLDYYRGELLVTTTDFTPAHYFQASDIFHKISVKLKNSTCNSVSCIQSLKGKGSFFVQQRKVDFKNEMAWLVGSDAEVLRFHYFDLVTALFEPLPVLKVVSEQPLLDFISQYYFQKPLHELADNEQKIIRRDQAYFKVMKERFDPNRPKHIDTFLLRSPSEMSENK